MAHRYWRIFIRYNTDNSYVGLNELQLRDTPGGPDLTQTIGGVPAASAARAGRDAAKAFDGDISTIWDADNVNNGMGYWLSFAFPTAQDIVEIAVMPDSENVNRSPWLFEVQASDDNIAWSQQWLCTGVTYDGGSFISNYAVGVYSVFTKPVIGAAASRYFLNLPLTFATGSPSGGAFSVAEMRLFESLAGPNVAQGKGGLTDSQYAGNTGPSKAFDNDINTFYGGNGAQNGVQYVAVDFGVGNSFAPNRMQLVARNDGNWQQICTSGLCYKSNDGKSWELFGAYNGLVFTGAADMQEVIFATGEGAIVSQLVAISVDYEYTLPRIYVNFNTADIWGFPLFIQR